MGSNGGTFLLWFALAQPLRQHPAARSHCDCPEPARGYRPALVVAEGTAKHRLEEFSLGIAITLSLSLSDWHRQPGGSG